MGITAEQLTTTLEVLLVVFGAIITCDKIVDIIKKWKSPSTDIARKLDNDNARLDKHQTSIDELQISNRVLCSGVMALLDHELHNGNSEQMQKARDRIMNYLENK